jgi:hypothetical protein
VFVAPISNHSGYARVEKGNEDHLKDAVASKGPVVASIDAGHNFKHYKEGDSEEDRS